MHSRPVFFPNVDHVRFIVLEKKKYNCRNERQTQKIINKTDVNALEMIPIHQMPGSIELSATFYFDYSFSTLNVNKIFSCHIDAAKLMIQFDDLIG